jgi:hypothetical protein
MACVDIVPDNFVEGPEVVERSGKHRVLSAQVLAGQVTSDDSLQHRASLFPQYLQGYS